MHQKRRSNAFPFVQVRTDSRWVTFPAAVPSRRSSEDSLSGVPRTGDQPLVEGLRHGQPSYHRASLALLFAGLASFNAMYCTQALMPELSTDLHASPAQSALTVSATTGILALAILPASILSERLGRGRVIVFSALAATIVGQLLAFAPSLGWLVAGRGLQGLLLSGVPATAMAWLAQEIHPKDLPRAMGLYVAGNSVGGLIGRLLPSGVLQFAGWRTALNVDMALALTFSIVLAVILPKERRFRPKVLHLRSEIATMVRQWRDPRLAGLFGVGFIFMGVFVSLYNFLGYRLTGRFGMPPSLAGLVFLLYLFGTLASARGGRMAAQRGRGVAILVGTVLCVVGLPVAASGSLWMMLPGVAAFTYGFFTVHAVASGWVGALAPTSRGEASGMYLTCYYLGSSILGYLSGHVFHAAGWTALMMWLLGLVLVGCALAGIVARSARRLATA
ncbi:MFS transporter [Acidipropionibacterium jensenii]|nr:MFS transporter [Acidipropionibacterium jensenii]